jgi:hypothetical protein
MTMTLTQVGTRFKYDVIVENEKDRLREAKGENSKLIEGERKKRYQKGEEKIRKEQVESGKLTFSLSFHS